MGFIGIFVGPVVVALAGALWSERTTRINRDRTTQVATGAVPAASQPMVEARRPIVNYGSGQPVDADYLVLNSARLEIHKTGKCGTGSESTMANESKCPLTGGSHDTRIVTGGRTS